MTRCMFLHQQRLHYAATGVQRLLRSYNVRRRFRIREKVSGYDVLRMCTARSLLFESMHPTKKCNITFHGACFTLL